MGIARASTLLVPTDRMIWGPRSIHKDIIRFNFEKI